MNGLAKVAIILTLFIFSSPLCAQDETNSFKYWMTFGGWMGEHNLSLNFNYCFSLGTNFYKAGYLIKGGDSQKPTVGTDGHLYNTFDISVGKRLQSEWFQVSLFTGPSFTFGRKKISENEEEKFYTAGLGSNIQLLFRPANEIGIGIDLYGNLNFVKNYAGININVSLGNGK